MDLSCFQPVICSHLPEAGHYSQFFLLWPNQFSCHVDTPSKYIVDSGIYYWYNLDFYFCPFADNMAYWDSSRLFSRNRVFLCMSAFSEDSSIIRDNSWDKAEPYDSWVCMSSYFDDSWVPRTYAHSSTYHLADPSPKYYLCSWLSSHFSRYFFHLPWDWSDSWEFYPAWVSLMHFAGNYWWWLLHYDQWSAWYTPCSYFFILLPSNLIISSKNADNFWNGTVSLPSAILDTPICGCCRFRWAPLQLVNLNFAWTSSCKSWCPHLSFLSRRIRT